MSTNNLLLKHPSRFDIILFPVVFGQAGDHDAVGGAGVEEAVAAHVDADMHGASASLEEHEVARLQVCLFDFAPLAHLLTRCAWELNREFVRVDVLDESAAIYTLRSVSAEAVRCAVPF